MTSIHHVLDSKTSLFPLMFVLAFSFVPVNLREKKKEVLLLKNGASKIKARSHSECWG